MRLRPQSGWPQEAPPRGAQAWESPCRFSVTIEFPFPLTLFKGLLFSDVFLYGFFFIQPNCADAICPAPGMLPRQLLVPQNPPFVTHRTLALHKPYHKRHPALGRNAYPLWTWSGIRWLSTSLIPRWQHTSLITFPYSILFRYFGMMTIWYSHFHRTWDRLCHSCIDSSS